MCRLCLPRRALFAASALLPFAASADEARVEPRLRLAPSGALSVALTFDACPGGFDTRIASHLIANSIPATLFVTGVWLRHNPDALTLLLAHRDLFEFENHGARHIPPVLGDRPVFGLRPAGDAAAILREVTEGAAAVAAATGVRPAWYRGATAIYSRAALPTIAATGQRIGGFSLSADQGASLPAAAVAARMARATDGDVIIAHINQPHRPSGAGVVSGIQALQARRARFIRLDAAAHFAEG